MERALTRYFLGHGTKKECFDQEEDCSDATFYTWREKHPQIVQAIEDNARLRGLKGQRGEDIAFESRQKRRSHEIQEWAIDAFERNDIKAALIDLALGTSRTVMMGDEEKHIVAYPRDQIQALELLQELARGGTLPEAKKDALEFLDRIAETEEEEEEHDGTTLDDFVTGVPAQFTRITAETADGRKLTAEVSQADVVEGESHEV
jgi:hypothetical protein